MPKVKWNELNEIIHAVKNNLCKTTKNELLCKEIKMTAEEVIRTCKREKKESLRELNKLHKIVLKQVNGNEK